jgi:ribosomal protein S6
MADQAKFDKLNRLRVNAGKNPLKAWKGSQEALDQQITAFEGKGIVDVLPGAAVPPAAPPQEEKKEADVSGLAQPVEQKAKEPEKKRPPAKLARGVDGAMTEHSRKAIADQNRAARKDSKAATAERKKDKKAKKSKIKDNKDGTATKTTTSGNERRLGQDLAERIKKQREAKNSGKPADPNNFTVAELARELDIDPKVARAKLRRHEDDIKKLHSKGQDRWTFPNKAKDTIKKILKPK